MSDIQEYDADEQVVLEYAWIENLLAAKAKVEKKLDNALENGVVSQPDTFGLIGDISFLLGYINSLRWHLEKRNAKKETE